MDMSKITRLVINVDMVKGFTEKGNMADPGIQKIIPRHIEILEQAEKDENTTVAFVVEFHGKDSVEFKKFPYHCEQGTEEAEVVDALKRFFKNAYVFRKNSTSAIFAQGFMDFIKTMPNLKEVVIIGCCTDICILNVAIPLQNYFDQMDMLVTVIVPKDAVETYDAPYHNREEYNEMAFKLMAQAGIKVE